MYKPALKAFKYTNSSWICWNNCFQKYTLRTELGLSHNKDLFLTLKNKRPHPIKKFKITTLGTFWQLQVYSLDSSYSKLGKSWNQTIILHSPTTWNARVKPRLNYSWRSSWCVNWSHVAISRQWVKFIKPHRCNTRSSSRDLHIDSSTGSGDNSQFLLPASYLPLCSLICFVMCEPNIVGGGSIKSGFNPHSI